MTTTATAPKPDNIARAIAAAGSRAAAPGAETAEVPAVIEAPATPTAAAPVPGRRSIEDKIAGAGLAISNWLGVTEDGLKINKGRPPLETLDVTITLGEVIPCTGIRWTTSSGTSFAKTFDGITEVKSGRPWAEVVAQAGQLDPRARPYESSDIPLRLLQAVSGKSQNGDAVSYDAGSLVGFSTNWSNEKEFAAFLVDAHAKYGKDTPIKAQLGFAIRMFGANKTPVVTWTIAA